VFGIEQASREGLAYSSSVEYLPSKHKALTSNNGTTKKKFLNKKTPHKIKTKISKHPK
jgi:hypothetical protein